MEKNLSNAGLQGEFVNQVKVFFAQGSRLLNLYQEMVKRDILIPEDYNPFINYKDDNKSDSAQHQLLNFQEFMEDLEIWKDEVESYLK